MLADFVVFEITVNHERPFANIALVLQLFRVNFGNVVIQFYFGVETLSAGITHVCGFLFIAHTFTQSAAEVRELI